MNTQGISLASQGLTGEGWFDPYSLLSAFRKKAQAIGVSFIDGYCVGMDLNENQSNINSVQVLKTGSEQVFSINSGSVVNCAGPYGAIVASLAGVQLPIEPRRRFVYVFDYKDKDEVFGVPPRGQDCSPMVIDTNGVYVRPEGRHFITGVSPDNWIDKSHERELKGQDPTVIRSLFEDIDYNLFDEVIWPTLAHRIPEFSQIKLLNAWMGLYDYNTFDQNGIVGRHTRLGNFYLCNGFSGHGIQQSPGIGRELSELILNGRFGKC